MLMQLQSQSKYAHWQRSIYLDLVYGASSFIKLISKKYTPFFLFGKPLISSKTILLSILVSLFSRLAFAGSPLWSTDCEALNTKTSNWFLMDEREDSTLPIFIGNEITVIPYPGLQDIKNLKNDPRIHWLSKNLISVSNSDEKAGWEGRLIFYRCKNAR